MFRSRAVHKSIMNQEGTRLSKGNMTVNKRKLPPAPSRWYRGADVPMRLIRRFARRVADRFGPDKIVLFGSYAYGQPHADSDVDILVIMPARNQLDQAFRIHTEIDPTFPVDLIVRTPRNMAWRLAEGDSFLQEIVSRGKVLYEKADGRLGEKGRGRHSLGHQSKEDGPHIARLGDGGQKPAEQTQPMIALNVLPLNRRRPASFFL